jgi:predicted CXXCH cytochrome family protein
MKMYLKVLLLLCTLPVVFASAAYAKEDPSFKLKPDAYSQNCLRCHSDFQEKLKKPFVHTPVKKDCTGCHSPHASSHDKLLTAEVNKICSACHEDIVPEKALSVHKPVGSGECVKCHDPHSADHKNNLLSEGNALCFTCHKELGARVAKVKHKHHPVEKGCMTCHQPHASVNGTFLLKNKVNLLCLGCHKPDRPIFLKQHMGYPVTEADCTGCHDPHGSDLPGLLYNNVHRPVASRMCNQCHEEASSKTPLKIKRNGFELCRGCHAGLVNGALSKKRMHWPLMDNKGCLNCHNPHASSQKGLLKAPLNTLCGSCHQDTIKRQEKSVTKHEPVAAGLCTSCHDPHGSDSNLLFKQGNVIELCGNCHDWMKHATHPIGPKVADPRNKNATVQCLSCHRAHGTEFKNMMPFSTTTETCIQCHEQYRR